MDNDYRKSRPKVSSATARVVVQGAGDPALADPFRELAAASPGKVAFIERFDRDMARRIYAGADLFVMPSRFEPSGQGQMIAMRYGTPPIVRRTGGLAGGMKAGRVGPMAGTEYGKHMGELKRGEQRWDVYLEGQPDTSLGAVRGRIHFVSGQQHKTTGWIFLEWQEKDIHERFGEFSAVELLHFVESL